MGAADGDEVFPGKGYALHLIIDDGEGVGGDGESQRCALAGLEVNAAESPEGADGEVAFAGLRRPRRGDGRNVNLGDFVAFGGAGIGYADGDV